MRRMRYGPMDWLDAVVMQIERAASSWVNAVFQDISIDRRPIFRTWYQFTDAMVQKAVPITEIEEARKQFTALE